MNSEPTLLPVIRNPRNKFTVATVHYTADPDKATEAWVRLAKQGMPERGWMREYEIDYTYFEGKSFFPEFRQYNIQPSYYRPKETLYRGWDYGFHRPACLITKLNEFDQWCWMKAIMGKDEGIMAFGKRIREFCIANYPGALYIDVGDPAGEGQSDKSEKTSVQILETLGIFVRSRRMPTKHGAEIIRQKLPMRIDGKPGLIINPEETLLIDGFKGGLHYPELRDGRTSEHYEKDGYYDHIFDCGRYLATDMFTVIGQQQPQTSFQEGLDPNQQKYRMGRPADDGPNNPASDLSNDIFSDSTELGDFF